MGSDVQVVTVTVLFEAKDGNEYGLRRHVLNAVKGSCRNARDACVGVIVHDESGRFLGSDVTGTPSEEMQAELNALQRDEVA